MEFLVLILIIACIYLWLKAKSADEKNKNQPRLETTSIKTNQDINSTSRSREVRKDFGTQSSIPELDRPGMQHRINQYPDGHVCYLLYSDIHSAYKVGVSRPKKLANRILDIRRTVPDAVLTGTRVFTSFQNAYDAEQNILRNYSNSRYRGIEGREAGRTEWITRRPTGRNHFPTPARVEEIYQERSSSLAGPIEIEDIYTVYICYSSQRNKYKIKWCRTENLQARLRNLRSETPDAELLSRMPFDRRDVAARVCIEMNRTSASLTGQGRNMHFDWVENPISLAQFREWTSEGIRR